MNTDAVVIGGGVSGLAAAYDLKRRGHEVLVLERQAQIGGNAVSETLGGFLMEHGPSTMNAHIPAAGKASTDLGLDDQRCDLGSGVRHRYLVDDGTLAAIPVGPFGLMTAKYLSPIAKIRLLADLLLPHRSDGEDESVMAFCSRRFGREVAERVIDPLVAGIYAGRAADLSVLAIFPKLVALEKKYGSVTLGMIHRRREGGKMPGTRLFSWRGGISTLPSAMARNLGDAIRTGVVVRKISRRADGFHIDVGDAGAVNAKVVIVATQPHVAARLIADVDPAGARAAEQIYAPPLAVVFLGFHREQVAHPLDGLGFLTSESENRNVVGAQFCSTMFPNRAPRDHVAVSAYIGGARSPDIARLPAPDLVNLARGEFHDLIGAVGEPTVARVRHWPLGLPQYGMGHPALVKDLTTTADRLSGLYLTGNYLAGPSVATCLEVAQETALAADGYLKQEKESSPTTIAGLGHLRV
ncbi:MAG: protoporphyrinogen oxidase [Rhodospirillaceae bacterium]|jgi:protoporphyrinogen/coproporphyrinogen III oxidase|nr:protoporphyrinogen oxidase [Rhodospirillaceae bacterium]MBT5809289.1 protoporphyrinogen oxidase [Rhodospirillaceae bacterium]